MERLATGNRPYRPLIKFEGVRGSTIGANVMQGHSISYEIDKNRIGFAESSKCEASYAGSRSRSADSATTESTEVATESGATAEGEASGVLSINTASTGSTASSGTTSISTGNDDLFVGGVPTTLSSGATMTMNEEANTAGGGCTSANCRCFMSIGYVFIGSALAVAYRISRPKERTLASFEAWNSDVEQLVVLDDTPAYRRKSWHEGGTLV